MFSKIFLLYTLVIFVALCQAAPAQNPPKNPYEGIHFSEAIIPVALALNPKANKCFLETVQKMPNEFKGDDYEKQHNVVLLAQSCLESQGKTPFIPKPKPVSAPAPKDPSYPYEGIHFIDTIIPLALALDPKANKCFVDTVQKMPNEFKGDDYKKQHNAALLAQSCLESKGKTPFIPKPKPAPAPAPEEPSDPYDGIQFDDPFVRIALLMDPDANICFLDAVEDYPEEFKGTEYKKRHNVALLVNSCLDSKGKTPYIPPGAKPRSKPRPNPFQDVYFTKRNTIIALRTTPKALKCFKDALQKQPNQYKGMEKIKRQNADLLALFCVDTDGQKAYAPGDPIPEKYKRILKI